MRATSMILFTILAFATIASGCSSDRSGDDSARSDSGTVEDAPDLRLAESPLVRIGRRVSDSGAVLHQVVDPVWLADGRIAFSNAGHEIQFYDEHGTWLQTVGSEGEGPGEYRSIAWLQPYRGDSVAVYDGRLGRITIVGPDGLFVRTVVIADPKDTDSPTTASLGSQAVPVAAMADGRFLARAGEVVATGESTTAVRRDSIQYLLLSSTGELDVPLGWFPDNEQFVLAEPGRRSVQPLAFGRTTSVRVHGNSVFVADNQSFSVHEYEADGTIRSSIGSDAIQPRTVSAADRERWRASALAQIENPVFRQMMKPTIEAMQFPENHPFHGELVVAENRGFWLARHMLPDEDGTDWVIFDPHGDIHATVSTPEDLRVEQVTADRILGLEYDALDVPHVVVYEINHE